MIFSLFKIVSKEYFRTEPFKKFFQFIFFIISPIYLFLTMTFQNPSMIVESEPFYFSTGYLLTILVFAFTTIYFSETDDEIFSDFPLNYIPLKKFILILNILVFLFILLSVSLYFTFFLVSFALSKLTLDGKRIFSFIESLIFLKPLLLTLPINILSSILWGSLIGLFLKKFFSLFEESLKRIVRFLTYFCLLIIFKPYFLSVYSFIEKKNYNDMILLLSPSGLFSTMLHMVIKRSFNLLIFIPLTVLIFIFFLIKIFLDRDFPVKEFSFSYFSGGVKNGQMRNIPPIWRIVFKRVFSLPLTLSFLLWFILFLTIKIFPDKIYFLSFMTIILYIYIFLFFDRILPSSDENYRHILDMIPVKNEKFEGVVYFFYYIFLVLPLFLSGNLSISVSSIFKNLPVLDTVEYKIFLSLYPLSMAAIFPLIYSFYPDFLSENRKGKKISKISLFLIFVTSNFILSIIVSIISIYYFSPEFRIIFNNLFWGKGYILGKSIFYFLFIFFIMIHLRALYKIVKSFNI